MGERYGQKFSFSVENHVEGQLFVTHKRVLYYYYSQNGKSWNITWIISSFIEL